MQANEAFEVIASQERIDRTVAALKEHGIDALVVENGAAARQRLFELLPAGAEVMNMTSMTLEAIDAVREILESGRYDPVRKRLMAMDKQSQGSEMRKLGAGPDWAVGSVHAVTEDGTVLIASATGSQLPAYAYGAARVIWVVGAQKLVKDFAEGMRRIHEYSLPHEDARARKAYGAGSGVNKVLVIRKEATPGRITMILVKERLGF